MKPIVDYSATGRDPYIAKSIQQVKIIERALRRIRQTVTDVLSSLK